MSDQTPPDQTSPTANEQDSADVSARLASLGAPRPGVTSIWARREATAPTTPPSTASSTGIGRLTRVSAAELWTDATAMATWIFANPDALSELTGAEGLRFRAPTDRIVLGVTADGKAVCVVCEVAESSDEGLGALLRTATVQDGGTVVWLNGGPSDSHVAALSWLNRATPPRFYLAKVTGVRIDGSASAPMFDLLVRPPRATEPADDSTEVPRRRVEDHVPED
jgi:hypothetical protein